MAPIAGILGLGGSLAGSLLGGHASHTDRKTQLQSWQDLQNLFNYGSSTGEAEIGKGTAGLDKASDYFGTLMSGDRAKMSQVLAPQISSIKGQTQQRINTLQQLGNRSGGTNAAVLSSQQDALGAIQNLFDMLGPEAAKEFVNIAGLESGLGSNLLGIAGNAAANMGAQAGGAREGDIKNEQAFGQSLGGLLGNIMNSLFKPKPAQ